MKRFLLLLALLAAPVAADYPGFHYDTVCTDDPTRPGWKTCNAYWNLGEHGCNSGYPENRIYYSQLIGTAVPQGKRLWVRSVYNSIFGGPNGGYFNSYLWYSTGWYNTCKAMDTLGSCERKFDLPGAWLDPGDWVGGWLSCNGGVPHAASVNVVFSYEQ